MELYKLPPQSWFTLVEPPHIPPDSNDFSMHDEFRFFKLDGMYSLCYDKEGIRHHFAAWTEVNPTGEQA